MNKITYAKMSKCDNCGCSYVGYGHNGAPLVDGFVCDACNKEVITERMEANQRATNKVSIETTKEIAHRIMGENNNG